MAKTYLVSSATSTTTANTTAYLCPCGATDIQTTETDVQIIFRSAGVLSGFFVRITSNAIPATSTITVRKNAAAGNQTVSIGSTATGNFEDITHTDTVAAADKIAIQFVPGTTTNTMSIATIEQVFNATTDTVSRLVCSGIGASTTASASRFQILCGDGNAASNTEANTKCRQRQAGTFKNLACNVSANARTTATTVTLRKNGANGNTTLSIGSGVTGILEDTTHSDTVVAGDDVNTVWITGTDSNSITVRSIAVDFVSTAGYAELVCGRTVHASLAAATTSNYTIMGDPFSQSTETSAQIKARFASTFNNLTFFADTNATTTASTITFRIGAANATQTISVGSAATGVFTDTTHSDNVAVDNMINVQGIAGATGALGIEYFAVWSLVAAVTISHTVFVEWEES